MWYKNSHAIGICEIGCKKQLFSFGYKVYKDKGWTKELLQKVALIVIKRMSTGSVQVSDGKAEVLNLLSKPFAEIEALEG